MTTGKTIALTIQTFVGKVMSLLLNMLSRFVMALLPRSKHLLISWLQSPSAMILELKKIRSVNASTFPPSVSVHFSYSVVSDSLWPHGLQHARLPCPSATAGAYSNSCPSSRWCYPTISSSVISFSFCLQSFPASGSFQMSQFFTIRWPKYWSFSFSISPFNEYSGLISFRIDWFDLLAVQGTLKSLLQHHSSKESILWHSTFFIVQLSHPYMTTGKTIGLTWQSNVSAFYYAV